MPFKVKLQDWHEAENIGNLTEIEARNQFLDENRNVDRKDFQYYTVPSLWDTA